MINISTQYYSGTVWGRPSHYFFKNKILTKMKNEGSGQGIQNALPLTLPKFHYFSQDYVNTVLLLRFLLKKASKQLRKYSTI